MTVRVWDLASPSFFLSPIARGPANRNERHSSVSLHIQPAVWASKIDSVVLLQSLASWELVIRERISIGQLANVVPDVLRYYDLPELAATLAPRPLEIVHPVSANNIPLTAAQAQVIFRPTAEAYRRAGAADRFALRTPNR
ncbi:hypothetical protein HRbin36_01074 [bacterium HR36]|nr:hypothetical protein HRbin36_01074 [bacterium HR36]